MTEKKQTTTNSNRSKHIIARLGRTSRILLIVGILLVILIPIFIIYSQQVEQQDSLRQELSSLQELVKASISKKTTMETQIDQLQKDIQAAKESYVFTDRAPEILGDLTALAEEYNMKLTSSQISTTSRIFLTEKQEIEYTVLAIQLSFSGRVPSFRHFLIDLDASFPMAEVKSVKITEGQEANEQAEAIIAIDVYCLDKQEINEQIGSIAAINILGEDDDK